jgi:hypothetical protein
MIEGGKDKPARYCLKYAFSHRVQQLRQLSESNYTGTEYTHLLTLCTCTLHHHHRRRFPPAREFIKVVFVCPRHPPYASPIAGHSSFWIFDSLRGPSCPSCLCCPSPHPHLQLHHLHRSVLTNASDVGFLRAVDPGLSCQAVVADYCIFVSSWDGVVVRWGFSCSFDPG